MGKNSGRIHLDVEDKEWLANESKKNGVPMKRILKKIIEKEKKKKKSILTLGEYDLRI